jgi:serine/threonine-protein kinase
MAEDGAVLGYLAEEARPSKDELGPGARVGDYVLGSLIARGGCAAVYHARHREDARHVALKLLDPALAAQPKMVERFLREVEVVNRLHHPGIVVIHEVGLIPLRRPYYVMEYLPGGTLDSLLRDRGRFSPEEVLDVLEPVCDALGAAHEAGVVHRDVKASNIAFGDDRRTVKLLDFGIAKLLSPEPGYPGLTTGGRQLGTPTIMAPEQILGGPVDARVDVYALGVLVYRLLTGRPPFEGRSLAALARQHLEEPPPRPSRAAKGAAALDHVVLRCLEKRPERRYASARGVAEALAAALGRADDGPVSTRGEPTPGVAVLVDLLLRDGADLDDTLSRDVGQILDAAEARLRHAGFVLAQLTGSSVLGVRPLPGDAAERSAGRRQALVLSGALRDEIARRPAPDGRVHVNVAVHAGEVVVRAGGGPEVLGGPLVRTAAWAPRGQVRGVFATPAALEDTRDAIELSDGSDGRTPAPEHADTRLE